MPSVAVGSRVFDLGIALGQRTISSVEVSDDTPPETSRNPSEVPQADDTGPLDTVPPPPEVGQVLDEKYLVRGFLGRGGMGVVLDVEHLSLGKRFAMKLLHEDRSADPRAHTRFEHEARTIAALGHANICDVYDFGQLSDGRPFLVLEKLDGESLADRLIREKTLSPSKALWVILQVLAALEAAHEQGIVHRDVKPPNVFISRAGGRAEIVKLLDFGVSKETTEPLDLTQSGLVIGTPAYMAPEQARGETSNDPRIDLYACGVMLYEMLTGVRPFGGDNYNQTILAILDGTFTPLLERRPELPRTLDEIVKRTLAHDPEQRFPSAQELQHAIIASGLVPMRLESLPPPSSVSPDFFEEQSRTFRKLAAAFGMFSTDLDVAEADQEITTEEAIKLRQDLAELEMWTRRMRELLARVAMAKEDTIPPPKE
jgi:serine/threonine-protein kinase